MKRRIKRFLLLSLTGVLALCIGVFSAITLFMLRQSDQTISAVGEIYMAEMDRQLKRHYETIIDLRLDQVENIVFYVPPEDEPTYTEDMRARLAADAQARGLAYLALLSTEGDADVLYGEPVTFGDPEGLLRSLNDGTRKISSGRTASGETLMLFGCSVGYPVSRSYPMKEGGRCTALIAGLPISYIDETLSLDVDESLIYSHIVLRNGNFLLQSAGNPDDNYFEWLLQNASFEEGTPEENVARLREAIGRGEDYSFVRTAGGQRNLVSCSPLPHSDWHLISVMPHGLLDESIAELGTRRISVTIGGFMLVLLALLGVFFAYDRLSRQQLAALAAAQREAERASRAKSEFLSNMSHDIRTPMNAIVGMTAIATANMDDPDQVRDCLRKITLSSKHLLGLINDVLDMSRIESGKLQLNMDETSLREITESLVCIVQPQAQAKRQHFDIFIRDVEQERVCCDAVRLNQVLINLLSNALKFTPEGGTIHVTLAQEPSPLGADCIRTHFYVQDNGIGMSEAFQKKIFESFVREDNARVHGIEGTGLGMAITKHIVDAMHGTIQVRSAPNQGSEFHVTLDLRRAGPQEEDMRLPAWDVLVVDDDEQLRQSAAQALNAIGAHADVAPDGPTALAMARAHAYHAVLLDWKMPGMDGVQTARQLRQQLGEGVPILLISAYDWSDVERDAREAGVSGFLSKPLFKSTLYYGLRRFAQEASDAPAEEPVPDAPDFAGMRLLVAEDNELNWEIACELLSAFGFEPDWAENGQICVDKFAASAPGTYAAVLMDLRMPVMNGYDAARAIRASGRPDAQVPIIAMTADAFAEDVQRCHEAGMNAHVAKPIDVRELVRLLQRYVRRA